MTGATGTRYDAFIIPDVREQEDLDWIYRITGNRSTK